jgi:hypothetical protein
MSGTDGPVRVGGLFWLVCAVACGWSVHTHVTEDKTVGLTYGSGDRPTELPWKPCLPGSCPPTGFRWPLPATGTVQTRFLLDDPDLRSPRGTVTVGGCAAVVDWALAVDGTTVVEGRGLRTGDRGREVYGAAPADATTLTFLVRRTDDGSCAAEVTWENATMW